MLNFKDGMYIGKDMFKGIPAAYISLEDNNFIGIIKKLQSVSFMANALLREYILFNEICRMEKNSNIERNISSSLSSVKASLLTSIAIKTACFFDDTKGSYSLSRLFNELSKIESRSCIILASLIDKVDKKEMDYSFSQFEKCKKKLKKLNRIKYNLKNMRNSILAHFDEDFLSGSKNITPDAEISAAVHWVFIFILSINRYAMFSYRT